MTNWSELSIFCSAIAGCIISLVLAIQKSKCVKISLCSGMCECDRNLNVVEDDIEKQLSNVQETQTEDESKEKEGDEKTPRQTTPARRSSDSSFENYRDTLSFIGATKGGFRIPSN